MSATEVHINKSGLFRSDTIIVLNIVEIRSHVQNIRTSNRKISACFLVILNNLKKNNSRNVRFTAKIDEYHIQAAVRIALMRAPK
jgi:hypothetical protein